MTNLDAKGDKRSVKMWTASFYKSFFKNMLLYNVHEQSSVKYSFSTYVCYASDGLFWFNLYNMIEVATIVKLTIFDRILESFFVSKLELSFGDILFFPIFLIWKWFYRTMHAAFGKRPKKGLFHVKL